MGGLIGRLLSFVRVTRAGAKLSDAEIDLGGGDIRTAVHAQGAGDDAHPLPGDHPVTVQPPRGGARVIVAYVETDADQKAGPGDRRQYARDGSRAVTVELWLKADGTAVLENANGTVELRPDGSRRAENTNGYYELRADGTVEINTATIDPAGNVVATSVTAPSIVADGRELAGHDHDILSGSSAPGPTGENNP